MSYQFDASQLRTRNQTQTKVGGDVSATRLLARRTVRQNRRAQRAL